MTGFTYARCMFCGWVPPDDAAHPQGILGDPRHNEACVVARLEQALARVIKEYGDTVQRADKMKGRVAEHWLQARKLAGSLEDTLNDTP